MMLCHSLFCKTPESFYSIDVDLAACKHLAMICTRRNQNRKGRRVWWYQYTENNIFGQNPDWIKAWLPVAAKFSLKKPDYKNSLL